MANRTVRDDRSLENKNPEDLSVLRVEWVTSGLAASAPVLTATLRAMTSYLPAVMAMVITALIAIVVARGDIHDRAARGDRTRDDDRRRATHYGGRARWDNHRNRARSAKDWQPEREVNRNSCLGGAGQSEGCNHCYQTEQMFCFHARFDGLFIAFFTWRKMMNRTFGESLREEGSGNE